MRKNAIGEAGDWPHRAGLAVPEFAYAADRLVRHLFDAGLRLHKLRIGLDRDGSPPAPGSSDALAVEVLDELDVVIHDSGLAMLALVHNTTDFGDGRTHSGRWNRRRGYEQADAG
ncbi:hypothetical protein NDR87_37030 [Nocardia sp. CDC159]|nr:hypothetical protein [Nocardia sp. CDC159]